NLCLKRHVYTYDDPDISTNVMSMVEGKRSEILTSIIEINKRKPSFKDNISNFDLGCIGLDVKSKSNRKDDINYKLPRKKFTSSIRKILDKDHDVEFIVDFET